MIVASPRECEESQDNAVLSQGINDRDQRFQAQTKPAVTGSVAVEMSFSSEKVLRLRIIAREKRLSPEKVVTRKTRRRLPLSCNHGPGRPLAVAVFMAEQRKK